MGGGKGEGFSGTTIKDTGQNQGGGNKVREGREEREVGMAQVVGGKAGNCTWRIKFF